VVCSIGDGRIRQLLLGKYLGAGVKVLTFVHPAVSVPRTVEIGPGTVVLPGSVLMPFARLGEGVYVSTGTGIAHHTTIGNYSSIASGTSVGAGISVGERVSFGVASAVMTGVRRIGDDAVVGAGAVVTSDVLDGSTVVGVPARPVRRP
jgi:sugar O-acyltransferase (sialic acid O-acetyltransferase NeuD family)